MPLTDQQVQTALEKPLNQRALRRTQLDNNRQRFHVGPATDEYDAGPYLVELKKRVKGILDNEEKYKRFLSLLQFPLPTSRLIDKAADEYLKAFRAEDRYIDYEMGSDGLKADADAYLGEIGFDDWLQKDLFNQCLRASGSVWIADLPALPNVEGFARPTVTLREFGRLTDLGVDERGNITYVIYPINDLTNLDTGSILGKQFAVIDDASFRVYVRSTGGQAFARFTNPHRLGKCPAGLIWHDRLDGHSTGMLAYNQFNYYNPLRIQSPLHALFSDLDDLVVGNIFRQHVDLYASFPMLRAFKNRCNYENERGEQCDGGRIRVIERDEDELPVRENGRIVYKYTACPKCAANKPIGPGSVILTPAPVDNLSPDLTNPVGFVNADRKLLDYNVEKLDALKADILEGLTGDSQSVDQTTTAVNQDQVQARFEARKGILSYWASHLEQTHYDVLWTLLSLRYGPSFRSVTVQYGSEFHLLSAAQAVQDYADARLASLPMYQLAARRTRLDKLLAGSSPEQAERMALLAELEPYPDMPLANLPVGSDVWELKANFSQYIARFERENISLAVFGAALSDGDKLNSITQILYSYVSANKARREVPIPAGGPGGSQQGGNAGN